MADQRIDKLIQAIEEAGSLLLRLWPGREGGSKDGLGIQSKSDGTLVSEADMQSNSLVLGALRDLFPSDAVLSEEIAPNLDLLRRSERTWIVDPLDGTSSFLHGRDDFSILVALSERHDPTLGIMHFPARGLMVLGRRGEGATCNGTPLRVSHHTQAQAGRVYIRNFESKRPELASPMMDSGLALLKVANGELDGAIIRMTTHREWDLAAPMAVLLEAGGVVSDQTGAEIRCGTGVLDFSYCVVSNGLIHQELLGLIPS
jgi:fructose-1,6-bisphosphatase/inositol monophosphatase family enzyme